ncbi:DNA polymerase III subunit delta [Bacteroides sp.]|uniref:DNA polymerase III subunit delta n=1 Tax=Bacteroides sp. TaxID=29523 RepID=UPI00260664F5|nr:hypothetical protein [Bacteroides sp.]MDD3039701.1 hypothetical protein [Bacteroides sp.]
MRNIVQIKTDLKAGVTNKFYVFTGEEVEVRKMYIIKIADISKTKLTYTDSVSSVFGNLQAKSMLSVPTCYVIIDDTEYMKQEKIWPQLLSETAQGDNIVILVCNKLDKRGKFYKAHEKIITTFDPVAESILSKRISQETGMEMRFCKNLAEWCGCNYSRILLEVDKIYTYAKAKEITVNEAFLSLVRAKLISKEQVDVVFDFVNCVCRREKTQAYTLLQEIINPAQNALYIVKLLYNNFKNMLLVVSTRGESDLEEKTGLTNWQIRKTKEMCGAYGIDEMVRAMRLLQSVEEGIKTGKIEAIIAVDYLLINIL